MMEGSRSGSVPLTIESGSGSVIKCTDPKIRFPTKMLRFWSTFNTLLSFRPIPFQAVFLFQKEGRLCRKQWWGQYRRRGRGEGHRTWAHRQGGEWGRGSGTSGQEACRAPDPGWRFGSYAGALSRRPLISREKIFFFSQTLNVDLDYCSSLLWLQKHVLMCVPQKARKDAVWYIKSDILLVFLLFWLKIILTLVFFSFSICSDCSLCFLRRVALKKIRTEITFH